jgi:adenylate cyclase class IV
MDLIFIILLIILCVLVAFYIRIHRLTTGGARRIVGGGKEIEARWLDIDIPELRQKIEDLGGELVHDEKQYRRYVFSLDSDTNDVKIDGKKNAKLTAGTVEINTKNTEKECKDFIKAVKSKGNGYVRTREEYNDGIVVTMTCKLYPAAKDGSTKHADEYDLITENTLEECQSFLEAVGVKQKAYHETRRIKYKAKGVNELVLDTIPGLPPYIEVEAKNEKAMFDMAKKLGLTKGEEHYGAYGQTFADTYGFTRKWIDNELDRLDFKTFAQRLQPMITKNKELFERVVKEFSSAVDEPVNGELALEEVGDASESAEEEVDERLSDDASEED